MLDERAEKMSLFETACFNWYLDNVTPFSSKYGLVMDAFKELRLRGVPRAMFIRGLNAVDRVFAGIRADNAQGEK